MAEWRARSRACSRPARCARGRREGPPLRLEMAAPQRWARTATWARGNRQAAVCRLPALLAGPCVPALAVVDVARLRAHFACRDDGRRRRLAGAGHVAGALLHRLAHL